MPSAGRGRLRSGTGPLMRCQTIPGADPGAERRFSRSPVIISRGVRQRMLGRLDVVIVYLSPTIVFNLDRPHSSDLERSL